MLASRSVDLEMHRVIVTADTNEAAEVFTIWRGQFHGFGVELETQTARRRQRQTKHLVGEDAQAVFQVIAITDIKRFVVRINLVGSLSDRRIKHRWSRELRCTTVTL